MPRELVPLRTDDLSAFTRALAEELGADAPSHLSLMNMVARAAGFRNYQHLRASARSHERLEQPVPEPIAVDHSRVERTLNHFDDAGRLVRWPSRVGIQKLAVWVFWADLPSGEVMTEAEVNDRFADGHLFADPATLRRMLVGLGLAERERDGSAYRRVELAPSAEAADLITRVRSRRDAASRATG